jgi:hypothetical protein
MTLAEAEDIADEQITYWRVRQSAHQSLRDLRKEHGGGWDRVRAALIRKALEMGRTATAATDAPSSVRGSERTRHSLPLASRPGARRNSLSSRHIDTDGRDPRLTALAEHG